MYCYSSPTGVGWTDNSYSAKRMNILQREYIQACIACDEEAKKRILGEEREILDGDAKARELVLRNATLQHVGDQIKAMVNGK